ncbi:flippase [Thermodesulfobacteriota bacterium]
MSIGARILKNTTFLTLGDKVGYLMQFIFFLYFAKKFGVVPVGEYSFAFFFTYAFAMIASSGLSVYLIREVARKETYDRKLFVDCLVIRVASLIIVSLLVVGVIAIFFRDISTQKVNILICWGVFWIFNQIADIFLAELNGHEKMGRVAFLGVLSKLMSAVIGFILIYAGFSYDMVMVAFPVSNFFYMMASIIVSVMTLGPIHFSFRVLNYYNRFFIKMLPFFFSVILIELINCQDVLILGFMRDDQSVGIYSSAIKLVTFIVGVAAFVEIAIAPVLSRLFIESQEKLVDISNQILRFLILVSLPLSFGFVLTADKTIAMLYSDSFQEASIVLKIAGWSIAVAFMQSIFSALLTAMNRQKEKFIFIGIAFITSNILNFIIIYYLDFVGAAVVKLLTVVLSFIFFVYLVSRFLTGLSMAKVLLKPTVGCLCMSVFIYFFDHWNLFSLIPAAGSVYISVLFLLGAFSSQELLLIKVLIPARLSNKDKP